MKEIERRFLCDANHPEFISLQRQAPKHIKQGYLLCEKDRQVRVRLTTDSFGSKCELCVKFSSGSADVRDEYEYEIPYADAVAIYEMCPDKVEKFRTSCILPNGVRYDQDTFPSSGLEIVEVEFPSTESMDQWSKPEWLGTEVTGKYEYSNVYIARFGNPPTGW